MSDMKFLRKLPDGISVEQKSLESISIKISSGGTPKTSVKSFYDGDIPWLRTQEVNFGDIWNTGVKITKEGLKNSSARYIPENSVIVAMYGATVGKIGINKIPMTTNQACANIQLDPNVANYRFIFHFLCKQYEYIKSLGSGSQTNINAGIVKKLQIPIPCPANPKKSLAIQAEIVRILDAFTELTTELTMRKKQYNHYQEQILDFNGISTCAGGFLGKLLGGASVEWVPMSDVAEVRSGWGFPKADQGESYGTYPFYKVSDMNIVGNETTMIAANNYINDIAVAKLGVSPAPVGSIIFPKIGAAIATNKKRILSRPSAYDNNVMGLLPNEMVTSGFLFHWMQIVNLSSLARDSGAVPSIRKSDMSKFLVPIPCPEDPKKSLAIQAEIVRILDKFNSLTTSLSEGLPREIELRKQQYEYYRDFLLSFPKPEEDA